MSVISKEAMLWSALPGTPCSAIIHPDTEACLGDLLPLLLRTLKGTSKYLVPTYVMTSLIKYKSWSKEFLLFQIDGYVRTTLMLCFLSLSFCQLTCVLRNTLGEFKYYTMGYIPAFVGSLGIFIELPKRRSLITNAITNMGIEGVLERLYNKKILLRSVSLETMLFMLSNAYLMYHLQQNPLQLWVFRPPTVSKGSTTCSHEGQCHEDVTKGYLTYFGLGVTFEVVKGLLTNFKKILSSPSSIPGLLFKKNIIRLGNFLGLYVAIYKLVCCSLRKFFLKNDPKYSIVAGFLAGQAYRFMPQHSFLTPMINQAVQSAYSQTKLSAYLGRFPLGELTMALLSGYLFHLRIVDPNSCPDIFSRTMNVCTSGKSDQVYHRFKRHLDQPSARILQEQLLALRP